MTGLQKRMAYLNNLEEWSTKSAQSRNCLPSAQWQKAPKMVDNSNKRISTPKSVVMLST